MPIIHILNELNFHFLEVNPNTNSKKLDSLFHTEDNNTNHIHDKVNKPTTFPVNKNHKINKNNIIDNSNNNTNIDKNILNRKSNVNNNIDKNNKNSVNNNENINEIVSNMNI